jgi:hypothetical protein
LEKTEDESIMGSLGGLCLFGDLRNKPPAVSAAQPDHNPTTPYDMRMRVECLLSKTNEQRELHIARLVQRRDARLRHGHCLIFGDKDMIEIMNTWKNEPEKWMKNETLQKLKGCIVQQLNHQTTSGVLPTMKLELFGNKSLTDTCIRYPVCSAEQPASIFKDFAEAWKAAHNSQELTNERLRSKVNGSDRLSKQIHALTVRRVHANKLVQLIAESWNNWYALSLKDRKLWEEHDDKYICRQIEELRSQQLPRFPGASSSIARSMKK